ncbi:MAG: hypothetical protein ACLGGW_06100, partial [Gammaproteobacteria bacterium]
VSALAFHGEGMPKGIKYHESRPELCRDAIMVKSSFIPYSLIFLVLVLFAVPQAQALGTEMFVCTGADGVRTYQNSDGGAGCVPLNLNPITVVPAPRSAAKGGGVSESKSAGSAGRRAAAAYDSRSAADFNAKDDRIKILQEELRIEESKLKSLQDEYKNGQPDRLGSEKNYQKYLDRVSRLEQEIMVTNDNIEILKTELIRLSK